MKNILINFFTICLTNCSTDDMVNKLENLDKAKFFDQATNTIKIGFKKSH